MTLDLEGNLIVADVNNHLIRKVTPLGTVSTIAGGTSGVDEQGSSAQFPFPSGVIFDPVSYFIFVTDDNNAIRLINSTGYVTTFAGSVTGLSGY